MTVEKRKRGRPRGSGKNDDGLLMKVAELRLANPTLKPTTAMRQVIARLNTLDATPETLLRRLQDKWMTRSAMFMEKACQQQEEQRKAAAARRSQSVALRVTSYQVNSILHAGDQLFKTMAAMKMSIPASAVENLKVVQKHLDRVGSLLAPEVSRMLDNYAQHTKAINGTSTMRIFQDAHRFRGRSQKI